MIREIISMPRADSGYPYSYRICSWIFKNSESKIEAKINSGHRVCLLAVGNPLLAYTEHAQHPLLVCRVRTHTHT